MSLVSDAFRTMRMEKFVPKDDRKVKQPTYGPVIIERPVRSMGRFFAGLTGEQQASAIKASRLMGAWPRPAIMVAYNTFKTLSENNERLRAEIENNEGAGSLPEGKTSGI